MSELGIHTISTDLQESLVITITEKVTPLNYLSISQKYAAFFVNLVCCPLRTKLVSTVQSQGILRLFQSFSLWN